MRKIFSFIDFLFFIFFLIVTERDLCVCVCFVVCGILVPRSGIESGLLCSEIAES